jgi:hypothetical protein
VPVVWGPPSVQAELGVPVSISASASDEDAQHVTLHMVVTSMHRTATALGSASLAYVWTPANLDSVNIRYYAYYIATRASAPGRPGTGQSITGL